MKREFLKELGIDDEAINKIMAENGNDINSAKKDVEKISAELEQAKADLTKANETLDKFKDYDNVKADVEKYKTEIEKSKTDYEQKLQQMELKGKVKDFTSGKKFVNDLTRNAVNDQLLQALNDETNKGKSLDDLLKTITDGQDNIFVNDDQPKPPIIPNMADDKGTPDDDAIRRAMGLPVKN